VARLFSLQGKALLSRGMIPKRESRLSKWDCEKTGLMPV
jgi:hypothetical protein